MYQKKSYNSFIFNQSKIRDPQFNGIWSHMTSTSYDGIEIIIIKSAV